MSENNITDVNEADFNDQVVEASTSKLIVVDFWAPWCGPCKQLTPSLEKVVGIDNVIEISAVTGAEDFSYFQSKIPGFYFFLGGTTLNIKEDEAPSHNTPDFLLMTKRL